MKAALSSRSPRPRGGSEGLGAGENMHSLRITLFQKKCSSVATRRRVVCEVNQALKRLATFGSSLRDCSFGLWTAFD